MNLLHFLLVRTAGVEPARGLPLRILSPVCLPVPPRPQSAGDGARNPGLTKRHPCPRNTSARVAKRYPRVTANLDNSNRANRQKLTWRGTAVWCRTIPWLGRGTMAKCCGLAASRSSAREDRDEAVSNRNVVASK